MQSSIKVISILLITLSMAFSQSQSVQANVKDTINKNQINQQDNRYPAFHQECNLTNFK